MAGTNEELLINFESPEKKDNVTVHNHYLKNPLIPGPDLNCYELESNNPFDVVAQSAENWDPFEMVLHQSLVRFGKNDRPSPEKCDTLVDGEFPAVNHRFNQRSNSVSNNVKFFPSAADKQEKSEIDDLNLSSRSLDNSPSLREKIKRVVKKRVSKCIERALNASASHVDLKTQEVPSPQKRPIRRSTGSSFTSERAKQEVPEDYVLKNFLEEAKQLSIIIKNSSLPREDSISQLTHRDKKSPVKGKKALFPEPKESFEEDLMSVSPPWEGIDSDSTESEDDSIGLPKVKLFYAKKKYREKKSRINQEQIAHYKRRIRASLEGNSHIPEETITEEGTANKTSQKPEEKQTHEDERTSGRPPNEPKEKVPLELLPVTKPIVPTTNDLRLKKVGSILKKGPLKAIVPLQKMTKTIAHKMSPKRKHSPSNKIKGKSCDDSSLSSGLMYRSVAASTPINKGPSNIKNNSDDSSLSSGLTYPPVAASTPINKGPSNIKKSVITPQSIKSTRISRRDVGLGAVKTRRSVSLSAEAHRGSKQKQPFSSINPNDDHKSKRPYTAPSPNSRQVLKSSPRLKKMDLRKPEGRKLSSAYDKENQL